MSVFKKSCFECGKKVDEVKENLCLDCYKEINPPINDIKPINVKHCNMCGRIHYNNYFYEIDEFKDNLHHIMKKRITLNDGYKLNEVSIDEFEIVKSKVSFNLKVDCDFTE